MQDYSLGILFSSLRTSILGGWLMFTLVDCCLQLEIDLSNEYSVLGSDFMDCPAIDLVTTFGCAIFWFLFKPDSLLIYSEI